MKFILSILAFIPILASAGEFTLMAGAAFFQPPQDGTYWNVNQSHDNFMTPAAYGVRYDSGTIAVQYTNFGKVQTNAMAVTTDWPYPGGYDPNTQDCHGTCKPLARWKMQSETQSVAIMVVKRMGNWSLEAGVNVYEVKTMGHVEYSDGSTFKYKTARYLDVGPMAGVGYKKGAWSVRAQLWFMEGKGDPNDGYVPPGDFNASYQWSLLVGYTL